MPGTETATIWAQRLRRFDQANLTVAKFCDSEGVSQPSYYYWKRKLSESAASTKRKPPARANVFLPVTLPSPFDAPRLVGPSHTVTTIELPGGIRIRIEVPADQPDTTPNVTPAKPEANQ